MKVAFFTDIVSPHQLPLARELVKLLGRDEYRYVYTTEGGSKRRIDLGWGNEGESWCLLGDENSTALIEAEVLMSGIRALDVFEKRIKEDKKTFYCSERWFKPWVGILRLFVPSYFKMAKRVVKLLCESENFYYLPIGIHAARDMARLCGLINGDWKCLFRAPKLKFERMPGGKIWVEDGSLNMQKYCLDKMRIWGYFVEEGKGKYTERRNENGLRVLWVGRLLGWKRVDSIIRAVGECAKTKKITLDIYGLGPEEHNLKKLAAKYGDTIKFYPPVPIAEVRNLMQEHDVYVLSSNGYEGWGAVVSEALEEGMTVLGTYEAGSSATVLPYSHLYKARDTKRLKRLLLNHIDLIHIGEWSIKRASKKLLKVFYDENGVCND